MCHNCVLLNQTIRDLEARIRQLEATLSKSHQRSLEDSFALDNLREREREESDRRVGEMGGGG